MRQPFANVVTALGVFGAVPALADGGVPVPVALFGRLHFPLLHFPIVLLFAVLLLELTMKARLEGHKLRVVVDVLLVVAAVSAVVTALAGLAYAAGEDFSGASYSRFLVHRATGIGVAVATVVLVVARRSAAHMKIYLPLLCAAVVAVTVTGHAGGELVHGVGFFTKPLHAERADGKRGADKGDKKGGDGDDGVVSYDDGDGSGDARVRAAEGPIPEKPDFQRDIAPIFERSCVKCHGPEKRKGGLRLDAKRYAMKGGESGPIAVVPGDAQKSLVYTMAGKPPDYEDVMPPKGKLLALSEIETLKRWIEQGAAWPDDGKPEKK